MAWPTPAARTKTWGTEVLTASDLQGQFDLGFTYSNDSLNGSTGHKHSGSTNDGPQIPLSTGVTGVLYEPNGGTGQSTYSQGDTLYGSTGNELAILSAGTNGQALTTGGASANPAWAGMTTQGDVEYHNGTTRTALAAGTAGNVLKTGGTAANASWTNSLANVLDYGTSGSSSTAKQGTATSICFGNISVPNKGTASITNLPFSSSTSYKIAVTFVAGTLSLMNGPPAVAYVSGSQATIENASDSTFTCSWIAVGT